MIDLSVLNSDVIQLQITNNAPVTDQSGNFLKLTNNKAVSIKNIIKFAVVDGNTGNITPKPGCRSFESGGKIFFTDKDDSGTDLKW